MEFAASPIFHLFLLSVGMGLCTYLFVSLKRDIFRVEGRSRKAEKLLSGVIAEQKDFSERAVQEHEKEIGELRQGLKEVTDRVGLLTPSAPPVNGINLVKRSQVLQMSRRGNRADQIASCLHVPQNEVDLVLKVNRMVISSF